MNRGFTFIEVLVAMLIFTMAALAATSIVQGAVRATGEAKEISQATWLLQNKVVDVESRLEALGIERACIEKETGKFDSPNERFTWTTYCYPIDFKLSETAARLAAQSGEEGADIDPNREDAILKMVFGVANDYLTRSTREIHVEVQWMQGKTPRQLAATVHFVRYNQQPAMPGGAPAGPGPGPGGS